MDNKERSSIYNEIVNDRYSCRQYSTETVSRETISAVLESALLAPSACNRQPWKFVVAEKGSALHQYLLKAYDRSWVRDVQVFIVACGIHNEAWKRADGKDHTDIDVAIAVEHICLAATSLGLCTCWICNFDAEKLTEAMELPENVEPIAIIPLGYASPEAKKPEKTRKPLNEIVSWEKF